MLTPFQSKVRYLLALVDSGIKISITFVIGLARNAYEQASPGNAQVLDLPLREALPSRFLTM